MNKGLSMEDPLSSASALIGAAPCLHLQATKPHVRPFPRMGCSLPTSAPVLKLFLLPTVFLP